jgi:YXWGXW repeat-containing protein
MKHGFVIAAAIALASAPALAQSPIPLHGASTAAPATSPWAQPGAEVAQAPVPAYPPAAALPFPPPAAQSETPPPASSPSYVWETGHWAWNGLQYVWQPGRYVERPSAAANFVPGHWEHEATGWAWVEGRWEYPGVGSSTPPSGYPAAR